MIINKERRVTSYQVILSHTFLFNMCKLNVFKIMFGSEIKKVLDMNFCWLTIDYISFDPKKVLDLKLKRFLILVSIRKRKIDMKKRKPFFDL